MLEVRFLDGRIRIARKERLPNAGDPPRVPSTYDPYGPGETDDDLLIEEPGAETASDAVTCRYVTPSQPHRRRRKAHRG